MEILWIILGALFILAGVMGSFLPVIPGPPLGYVGLLMLQLTSNPPFTVTFLIGWAVIVVVAVSLDSVIPAIGTKKFGGSRQGIYGCMIGAVAGLFLFPPFGIVIGPVIGAFAGELLSGKQSGLALKAATGSFIGFFVGTVLKVIISLVMGYYYVVNVW